MLERYMPPAFPKRLTHKEKYIEYINSEKWNLKKLDCLSNPYYGRPYECFLCRKNGALQVHHLSYKHLFNENDDELIILCKKCHKEMHFYSGKKDHTNIDINVFLKKSRGLTLMDNISKASRKPGFKKIKKWSVR